MKRTMHAIILPTILMTACLGDLDESAAPSDDNSDDSTATEADTIENLATPENPDAGTRRTHPYKVSWTFKSGDIHRCVLFTAEGKFVYISRPGAAGRVPIWEWRDQKVLDPTITAEVHHDSDGSCTGPATLIKLTMGQFWAGHACTFNPSLSVSFPWGVSLGAWPSCGPRKQAGFSTTYNTTDSAYTQHNSGSPVGFADYNAPLIPDQPIHKPCYAVFPHAVAFVKGVSDSFGANHGAPARKICLPR